MRWVLVVGAAAAAGAAFGPPAAAALWILLGSCVVLFALVRSLEAEE